MIEEIYFRMLCTVLKSNQGLTSGSPVAAEFGLRDLFQLKWNFRFDDVQLSS